MAGNVAEAKLDFVFGTLSVFLLPESARKSWEHTLPAFSVCINAKWLLRVNQTKQALDRFERAQKIKTRKMKSLLWHKRALTRVCHWKKLRAKCASASVIYNA